MLLIRAGMALLPSHDITRLLRAWSAGDQWALESLAPLIYKELHRAAHRYMAGEQAGHTLQTTALVNEVYLRLVDVGGASWYDRAHFFAVCAQCMRRILTDYARSRQAQKRGGIAPHVSLDDAAVVCREPSGDVLAVDDALNKLAAFDPRKSQVVELRFFGGLSIKEAAEVLKVSRVTVERDWKLAKAWLVQELSTEQQHGA
jgi:RNA polymerase sigma factor (TIGR02999 family)